MKELQITDFKDNRLLLQEAELLYYPNFLSSIEAEGYLKLFTQTLPWQQDEIRVFGKTFLQPRLTSFFAEDDSNYSYSGITMQPQSFPPAMLDLKQKTQACTGLHFSTCLVNYYRKGGDSMGWHADNEKELGKNPVIASLSLGSDRMFQFKHRSNKELRFKLKLISGSLLVMKGEMQHYWLHQVPKTAKQVGPRINLTFRRI